MGSGNEEQVSGLLDLPTTRMVTLTGPGGVGKTRLALEVAQDLESRRRDVLLVELAAIRRSDLVVPTIARAFGLTAGSEDLVGWIAGSAADRHLVLVLDNVEHLVGAAPAIAKLLQAPQPHPVTATDVDHKFAAAPCDPATPHPKNSGPLLRSANA